MAVINTNTKALFSQMALKTSGRGMAKAMEQLSTGKRINSGGDDAAGLAISTRMTQQIRSLNQAVRNAGDAISLIQTTEGATNEITEMLQRMRELAIQAINDTNSNVDRSYIDLEFQQLKQEIERVAGVTEWNGFKVLDGTAGERVGEMPMYKSTSVSLSGSVLINPTTMRSIAGTDAGEQQRLTFQSITEPTQTISAVEVQTYTFTQPTTPAAQTFTFGDYSIALALEDATAAQVASRVTDALNSGTFAGEKQVLEFSDPPAGAEQVITVGGVTVSLAVGDTSATAVATKVAAALNAERVAGEAFIGASITAAAGKVIIEYPATEADVSTVTVDVAGSNVPAPTITTAREAGERSVVDNGDGSITIQFATDDGNAAFYTIAAGGAPGVALTPAATVQSQGAPQTSATFSTGGKFLQPGTFSLNLTSAAVDGTVAANFVNADGDTIEMSGTLTKSTGSVVFSSAVGNNGEVIDGALTYIFKDAAGDPVDLTVANTLPIQLESTVDDSPRTGIITVAGVTVEIREADIENTVTFATRVRTELLKSSLFGPNSGRSISQETNSLLFTFAASDQDVGDISFEAGATSVAASVEQTRAAVYRTIETFTGTGDFKKSGSLTIEVGTDGSVVSIFNAVDGEHIALTGELDAEAGTVTFRREDNAGIPVGFNDRLISQDVVYTFLDSASNALDLTGRATRLAVDIEGGIPAMRAGDLQINGVEIGPSYPGDDTLSPPNNAAGSAIAKAAAINRKAGSVGQTAGESQALTFSGVPKPGVLTVAGISVLITENDKTAVQVASKVAAALKTSPHFELSTGRTVSYAPGSAIMNIDYAATERDVPKTPVLPGTTGLTAIVDVTREYASSVPGTGVFAKVNENVVVGRAMSNSSVVTGVVFINGYASADITTTLNNSRETRANVVAAINAISNRTGVKAIDTGSDERGVTLVAADGRNVEVRFETNVNKELFSQRIGVREGVQASTISLESKVDTPVILTASSGGDISRVGFLQGNFSRNESVFNTAARSSVPSPSAQVNSVTLAGASAVGDVYNMTINGRTISHTVVAGAITAQSVRDGLFSQLSEAEARILGVKIDRGLSTGELRITALNPGVPFTLAVSKSNSASAEIQSRLVTANEPSQAKSLGNDDLVINGIAIRPTRPSDDDKSNIGSLSSDRAASAIALAAAINSHSPQTGVRAIPNAVVSAGATTSTLVPATGIYKLYINGTTVDVPFVKAETAAARRASVVDAINQRSGQHGVVATDNGRGVTLSSDGRNLSVWFDSSIKDLSAASFGLEKGGAIPQVSRVSVGGVVEASKKATVQINGVDITSAVTAAATKADMASKLAQAVRDAITNDTNNVSPRKLANLEVRYESGDDFFEVVSTIAGAPFDLRGARTTSSLAELTLATVTPNSMGNNDVTAIYGATAASATAKTLYGGVRLVSDAKLLPSLPSPIGAPPNDQLAKLNATGKPIDVAVGARGFLESGNFLDLGFQVGSYGGRASEVLDPPKVGRMAFQVGASANQLITIDLADFGSQGSITSAITGDVHLNVDDRVTRVNTREGATAVLQKLDDVMDKVNEVRANMGAIMNRLTHAMDNLSNISTNQAASRSQIEDADYAQASTELAKNQIMQQAATAVLAQANMSQQTVLQLLQG